MFFKIRCLTNFYICGLGRWGGIWRAPSSYSFVATDNSQTNVELLQRFDNWIYEDYGIEKRMPWINGSMLTTSIKTDHKLSFGSIAGNTLLLYCSFFNAYQT